MTDKKKKSLIFKIAVFIGGFFVIIILAIFILLIFTADISKEELGPSPFKVDESIVAEDNLEYQTIIQLGKKITGTEEFEKEYNLDLNDLQPSILLLKNFLENNKNALDKTKLELFEKCKFPKQTFYEPESVLIGPLLKLLQANVTYKILIKDYESAKNEIKTLNHISRELLVKNPGFLIGIINLSIDSKNYKNIQLLLNQERVLIDQKFEILKIKQNKIPVNFFDTSSHFEINSFHHFMQEINDPNSISYKKLKEEKYYPIYTPFMNQPNKTAKLLRENALQIRSCLDLSPVSSYEVLTQKKLSSHSSNEFFEGNLMGKSIASLMDSNFRALACKILTCNNSYNQLLIAEKLIEYKLKTGSFPIHLADLKVDAELYTDIYTGAPFLYSAENGILQCVGKDKVNDSPNLTSKSLTPEEIHEILRINSNDFILYLK